MRGIVVLLLFASVSFADVVDYWGIYEKKEVKKEQKVEKKEKKKVQKRYPPPDVVLQESKRWLENKLKKEQPPIVYYYFKNPEKYKEVARQWTEYLNEKGRAMVVPQVELIQENKHFLQEMERELKQRGYVFLYFYNRDCPACKMTEPEIQNLERYFKVIRIELHADPEAFKLWNVERTPTVIAVSKKEKKAYRLVGYQTWKEMLQYFYLRVRGETR